MNRGQILPQLQSHSGTSCAQARNGLGQSLAQPRNQPEEVSVHVNLEFFSSPRFCTAGVQV